MNKKIIALALAAAFTFSMVGPAIADAATLEEQIAELMAKIVSLEAQIAGQTIPAATAVCFDADLQQGMTSDSVKDLQIKLGVTPTSGYFGPITLAAVKTFQTSNGIINTGYVGPLTRGALNTLYCTAVPSTTYPAGCTSAVGYSTTTGLLCSEVTTLPEGCTSAVGFSPTTGLSCAGEVVTYPEGCTSAVGFSPTTGLSCAGTTTTTVAPTEGSVVVSYDALPIDNLAVNRGATKDVMGIKVKAIGSEMTVTRLFLDINTRIWLSADSVVLLDGSTVLSTLPLSASTVTEVTAGSAYQLQFTGLNFVVPAGTTKVLTVRVSRPVLTSANAAVTVAATSSLRAVDGAGITDTYLLTARTWNMANVAASAGTLTASLNANSPAIQSISGLSAVAGTLTPVKLMDINLKAKIGPINITALSGLAVATGGTNAEDDYMASLELRDGTTVLSSVTMPNGGVFAFSSLDIDIATDATKTLSIWAQANHVATEYVVVGDSIHAVVNSITATTGTDFTGVADSFSVTGNAMYLFQYAPAIALLTTSAIPIDETGTATSTQTGADYSIAFSVTAPLDSNIYVGTASTSLVVTVGAATAGTSKTVDATGGTLVTGSSVSGVASKGTVATTFDKVFAGATRTFTITGHVPHGGSAGFVAMHLEGIQWTATDSAVTPVPIDQIWGISDFKTADVYVTAVSS